VRGLFQPAFHADNGGREDFVMPYIIGLTGGIGSGKSTATRIFGALGAAVVDTDAISHELTAPGGAAMTALRQAFGAECLQPDGSLDRKAMRERVFTDAAARSRLEGILHPLIRLEAERRIAAVVAPYVLLVVPLLLETGRYLALVQRVLVVDCDPEIQVTRTMARSSLAPEAVAAIMAAQIDRKARLAAADDVIDNSGDEAALRAQVEALHAAYVRFAGTATDR
jgi:dephospho-CoA kinase